MGVYVNPSNETKEQFLEREGKLVPSVSWKEIPKGQFAVVLIDNGLFTAAGVAYSERELQAFTSPEDFRPKKFYLVNKENLLSVSSLQDYIS